jgi:hypothetical protein
MNQSDSVLCIIVCLIMNYVCDPVLHNGVQWLKMDLKLFQSLHWILALILSCSVYSEYPV